MTVERLLEFLASMAETDHGGGVKGLTLEPWWVALDGLPDHDFNREIHHPGEEDEEDDAFPDGALRIMVDDDFWCVARLPYEFRDLSIETLVGVLWPEIADAEFRPDSGSDEQDQYYAEKRRRYDAWRKVQDARDFTGNRIYANIETIVRLGENLYEITLENQQTGETWKEQVDVTGYRDRDEGQTFSDPE